MTKFSDDGRWFWDGEKWQPVSSADDHWRWKGREWVAQSAAKTDWPWKRVGLVLATVLAGLFLLTSLVGMVQAATGESTDGGNRYYNFGSGLSFLSGGVLFALPLLIYFARRRH